MDAGRDYRWVDVRQFCVSTIMLHPSGYHLVVLVVWVSMLQSVFIQWD
jgi:hypothetical protein